MGVHTITICTDAFLEMARLEMRALGKPDLGLAVIEHPLANRDSDALEAFADEIMAVVESHFLD